MNRHFLTAATIAAAAALSAPAHAAVIRDCDETASVQSLAEPWEQNSKTFYKGELRVALLDTGGEPVCCSVHLMLLVPDKTDEMGGRKCHIVSDHDSLGFAGIDFKKLTSKYEDGKGLLLTFPYTLYVDGVSSKSGTARIRINMQNGNVTSE